MLDELVSILAHTEEICLLLGGFYLSATVGTLSVNKLAFRPEGLTRSTVHPLISSLINVTLIVKALENFLNLSLVILVRCADKFIIGNI